MAPVISALDCSISYGPRIGNADARVLSGVTLNVDAGEILGVVGATGSGKSSFGQVLSGRGLLRGAPRDMPWVSGGELQIAGIDLQDASKADLQRLPLVVGYLAPDSGERLRNDLTVGENIVDPILSRDPEFDRKVLGKAAATLLDAVDLGIGLLNKFPFECSRGQRQRIAFAQALIVEPEVLIVDEPAQGVDVLARPALFDLLERLNQTRQMTIVVISNDLASVERLTSRVLVLNDGYVLAYGDLDEILKSPTDPFLQRLAQARASATAPLAGVEDRDQQEAAQRVVDGLFGDISDEEAERIEAEAQRLRLLESRPEFVRFAQSVQRDADERSGDEGK